MIIVSGLQPVIQPVLKKEDNFKVLSKTFVYMTLAVGLLASIFTVIITGNATIIVVTLFGEKWAESGSYLSILGISILPNMLSFTAGYFQALNKPNRLTKISGFTLIAFILCLATAITVSNTIHAILIAVVVSNFLSYFYASYMLYVTTLKNKINNYIFIYLILGLFYTSIVILLT